MPVNGLPVPHVRQKAVVTLPGPRGHWPGDRVTRAVDRRASATPPGVPERAPAGYRRARAGAGRRKPGALSRRGR